MSLVTVAEAKMHLRVDGTDEDTMIGVYISAAEQTAISIVDRAIYADSTAFNAAVAAAPAALTTATATYTAAMTAAQSIADATEQAAAVKTADNAYMRAQIAYRRVFDGIVVNEVIKSAVLLIVGHLYANREDVATGVSVASLPNGADYLLQPYKVYE